MDERYYVEINHDYFIVIDSEKNKQIGKNYKYSRYAHNLQADLEMKHMLG